jgi:hypothetical protein
MLHQAITKIQGVLSRPNPRSKHDLYHFLEFHGLETTLKNLRLEMHKFQTKTKFLKEKNSLSPNSQEEKMTLQYLYVYHTLIIDFKVLRYYSLLTLT